MKANELRIGNWVYWGINIVPIKSIHTESVLKDEVSVYIEVNEKLNHYCVSINEITPIPLTPEILQKAGFSQQFDTLDWDLGYKFQINSHFILLSRNDTFYYIDAINTEVEYLHQLQNLYFALIGEELDINL